MIDEYIILNGIGLLTMAIAITCGIIRLRDMDYGGRLILLLLVAGLLTEILATWAGKYLGNNMPIYAVFNIVEVVLVSLFFNECLDAFKREDVGKFIAGFAVVAGVANLVWLQSIHQSNNNFMISGGVYMVVVSIIAIVDIARRGKESNLLHLRLNEVLLFYWAVSLLTWVFYDDSDQLSEHDEWRVMMAVHMLNWLTNLFFAAVFFFTPKQKHYG